ncbi:hypothetical protein DID88_005478 [Monilinia fructigena]|uniref:Uncharacterized protein n=1 Tax=Monilinia fructigena TaxID=38457 RepID=A0A395IZW4_9HELO|nr:hypothetical protein DID88_005478 [Monilinia fructigena]
MQIPSPQVLSTFPQPNYINPETRGPALLIITAIFLPIVYIVVGLRTFTRIYLSKHFGVDDIFLLIALIPTSICAVLALLAQERWKWNRHIWDVTPDYAEFGLKMSLLLECLFGLAVAFHKNFFTHLGNAGYVQRNRQSHLRWLLSTTAVLFQTTGSCPTHLKTA